MLPNWIIVGAPKSGTTSLFHWLADHPQVGASRAKETYYFSDPDFELFDPRHNHRSTGLEGYEELFAHCRSAKVVIESTPSYMYSETALRVLPHLPSQPNFIFMLREPVDQIKSLFTYFQNNWDWIPPHISFSDFITARDGRSSYLDRSTLARNALENANYVTHLRRWRDACGPRRIHCFLFEDMVSCKRQFMSELAERLGIDPRFYDTYAFPTENGTYAVRNRFLHSINMRLRPLLPTGLAYDALRRLYRKLNTRPATGARTLDVDVEWELSCRYAGSVRDLAREFGVDTTIWESRHAARLRRVSSEAPAVLRGRSSMA